jgi:hypothetical protein
MSDEINRSRRQLLVAAGATFFAVAQFGLTGSALAQANQTNTAGVSTTGASAFLASLKQVDAGLLNAGYVEGGLTQGPRRRTA